MMTHRQEPGKRPERRINAMTVDVEDYFQVSAFENCIRRSDWDTLPGRVEANVDRILARFEDAKISATFFTLGWVAQRYPQMTRRIVDAGHELASHGWSHVRVTQMARAAFAEDIRRTKGLLEEIGGSLVSGYRAPSYSIGRDNMWALEILEQEGYRYSSSIYPIRHDLYGMPEAPRFPFVPENCRRLLEIPVTTVEVGGTRLPCGGGGYFRLFPYRVSRWAIRRVNHKCEQPAVFYFHPWEIDPDQPVQQGLGLKTRFRHYLNLAKMEGRICRLVKDLSWDRMDRVFLGAADSIRAEQ